MIRVRFAPSPTGNLHIGGVRTALFNYLYAKNQGGQFLLRMEDTDRERSRPEYEKEIISSLDWLGLKWDEEIVYQSRRLERYQTLAGELMSRGLAYEEEREGKKAVKLKMPAKNAVFFDLVHGETRFDTKLFDDLVLLKSDGFPAFHFACVVDDHDMNISHVLRGDDHLSNTPRQIILFEALEWKPPKYGHLPLILGQDGSPLSKRHGAVALSSFREQGFLPEGVINYLALLGWGGENNEEFYLLDALIKKFSLKKVNKASARFDHEKLAWVNGQHLKKMNDETYFERMSEFYGEGNKGYSSADWKKLAQLFRGRIKTLRDLEIESPYLFNDIEKYDPSITSDFLTKPGLRAHLSAWLENMDMLESFDQDKAIEQSTREMAEKAGLKAGDLIHPLRFAVTGKTVSPGLFELMSVLGKQKCLSRVRNFLDISA